MSESEDHPMLPIQPNDRGKATAMGVFDRPAERYDDSTYAQRQLQLQQGRETPVKNHHSMESNISTVSDARSQSSSAAPRQPLEKAAAARGTKNGAEDPSSFFDDSDDSSVLSGLLASSNPPRLSVERPNDGDHPAFKNSAIPAPLSLVPRASGGLSSTPSPVPGPPQDSPTLGPNSGLSGMVRAHLRSDSNASSIYGMMSQDSEQTVAQSGPSFDHSPGSAKQTANVRPMMSRSPSRPRPSNDETEREEDEFARHLADGARRVREKLGSMVEVEMDKPSPTTAPSPSLENLRDVNPPRSNALGILKSKSSHTSLFDRHGRDQSQPRAMKTVMSSTSNGTLSPSRRGSTENPEDSRRGRSTQARERPSEDGASTDKEDGVHVGLKAFRQARLELQKMKELEAMQRPSERPPMGPRVGSHDIGAVGPPPAMFNRKARDESRHGSGSRATSRAGSRAPSERERSGSETSNTGPPPLRPMRLRNGSNAYDDQYNPVSPPGSARSASGMRHGPPSARQRPYEAGQPSPMASPVGMGTRSRTGSLLGATASTPNLLSNAAAPPLPPINPRRKNALNRASEDDMSSSRIPGGFPSHDESDDDTLAQRRQKLRKATSEGTSLRARNNPSGNGIRPPPMPQGNMPQGNMPGGRFLPGGVI
jgi:hypothetical protein